MTTVPGADESDEAAGAGSTIAAHTAAATKDTEHNRADRRITASTVRGHAVTVTVADGEDGTAISARRVVMRCSWFGTWELVPFEISPGDDNKGSLERRVHALACGLGDEPRAVEVLVRA